MQLPVYSRVEPLSATSVRGHEQQQKHTVLCSPQAAPLAELWGGLCARTVGLGAKQAEGCCCCNRTHQHGALVVPQR